MSKKIIILIAIIFSGFVSEKTFAEIIPTGDNPDFKSYKNYLEWAKSYCDSSERVWGQNNAMRPIPQYPELSETAVNTQIARTQNLSNISEEEKNRLKDELDLSRIGNFSGFKTLEVARLQYRSTMNSVFACAIVDSRLRILDNVRSQVDTVAKGANSEIKTQLDKEKTRLEREKNNLQCNSSPSEKSSVMKEIVNSATRQYCHYRYYLSYLDTNLEENRTAIEQIEKKIGNGNGTTVATNSQEWIASYNRYASDLDREIARADSTLPRAIRTFLDMEQAYPVHLMLTIIYDDYIRLRNNLSAYMNASTQTYLKAHNAQDANNR